jgi:glycine cleavage system H protein
VVEANARLSEDPGLVNRDPTGEGWFYKLEIADAAALDELMDEAGYQRFVESQA